jgi:hypothetical protein
VNLAEDVIYGRPNSRQQVAPFLLGLAEVDRPCAFKNRPVLRWQAWEPTTPSPNALRTIATIRSVCSTVDSTPACCS